MVRISASTASVEETPYATNRPSAIRIVGRGVIEIVLPRSMNIPRLIPAFIIAEAMLIMITSSYLRHVMFLLVNMNSISPLLSLL